MRYIVRVKAHETFADEVSHMKPHFSLAMQKSFQEYRNNNMSATEWWQKFRSLAALVLPLASVDELFACKTKWVDVETELVEVVTSGELGAMMFGKQLESISVDKLEACLLNSVASLAGTQVTAATIAAAKSAFMKNVEVFGSDALDVFPNPKTHTVNYRGVSLHLSAVSLVDQWNNTLWAFIKTVATDQKLIDSLWCEDQLIDSRLQHEGTTLELDLTDCKSARKKATEYIGLQEPTYISLANMFTKKGPFLCTIDRYFKIEQLFFQNSSGAPGEERFKQALLDCLPTAPGEKTPERSLGLVTKMGESKLAAWVGIGAIGNQQIVLQLLKAISSRRAPKFDSSANSDFVLEVRCRLAHFLVLAPSAGASDAQRIFGKEAAKAIVDNAVKKKAEGGDISVEQDLRMAIVFSWLLPDESLRALEQMRSQAVDDGPDVKRAKAGAPKAKPMDKTKCVSNLFKKV